MKTTLYIIDEKGLERLWSIEATTNGYEVKHGVVNGELQSEFTPIDFGMANRSQKEQIEARIKYKIQKRIEKGYSRTIEQARIKQGKGMNSIGLPRAMLAKRFEHVNVDAKEMYIQAKFDGMRCMIYKSGDFVLAYSRNGKPIPAITEIIDTVRALPIDEVILDGEIYLHGVKLQTILSWVKRRQPETASLNYIVYDMVSPERFADRYNLLYRIIFQYYESNPIHKGITLAATTLGCDCVSSELKYIKSQGFEGLILRCPETPYESGKRSSGLIKVKSMLDDEFKVIGIKASADNWAILTCACEHGEFNVSAPGNLDAKRKVLQNPDEYLGKKVTVEYSMLTKDSLPFHPVAINWRDKEDE